ncbi:MAG: YbaB/EbfC family nucleoid-associated protein [Betaproteobacteria bacterium]|nr:nucleoid-associated protein [Betaproteobacteria bacterium UKL13-2]HCG53056.1 YbaB/EbfC family nucleoid-associated protein [Betaproteobacteria bacterium]
MPKGGLGALMKQAQQMQENMKRAQEELASVEVEGAAGGGMVKVTMTCKHDVRRVSIDQAVMDDREMLEDLVAAAMNDAVRKAEAITAAKMGAFTQGMGMPPGFKLPF